MSKYFSKGPMKKQMLFKPVISPWQHDKHEVNVINKTDIYDYVVRAEERVSCFV